MIEIKEKKECCGCMACFNVCQKKCIQMVEDEEGFLYPKVDKEKCIQCGLCNKVCPYYKNETNEVENFPIVYAGWNKDEKERKTSSSGGIFVEIARKVIEQNGAVCAVGFENDNELIVHKIVSTQSELEELKGSKYVQSYIGNAYQKIKQLLQKNVRVLFVGTPCQIYALKNYLGKDEENLITIDLICHGVPSPKIYKEYINELEKQYKSKIKNVSFRNKEISWENFQMKIEFQEKKQIYYGTQQKDLFLKGFLKHLYIRPACHECKYAKLPRKADITLGDYWKIERQDKELNKDNLGTSAIVINTEKGKRILESLDSELYLQKSDINFLKQYNKGVYKSSTEPNRFRKLFFYDLKKNKGIQYLNKEYIQDHSKIKKIFQQLRLMRIREKK